MTGSAEFGLASTRVAARLAHSGGWPTNLLPQRALFKVDLSPQSETSLRCSRFGIIENLNAERRH